MQLFDDIDEKETIRRAKKKLSEYPRWREIACDDSIQKVTQEFTFQPRGGAGPNKAVENLAVRRVDAMIELEEIEQYMKSWKSEMFSSVVEDRIDTFENRPKPWKKKEKFSVGDVTGKLHIVLEDGVYVDTLNLTPKIQNQI